MLHKTLKDSLPFYDSWHKYPYHEIFHWIGFLVVAYLAFTGIQKSIQINLVSAATTITAASCSQADIQFAINVAQNGDTVMVPAGNCSWTSPLSLSKAIRLQASGTVTIVDDSLDPSDLLSISESPYGTIRVSGFIWQANIGPNTTYGAGMIGMFHSEGGQPILVDGNTFNLTMTGNAIRAATNQGVIWNNRFTGIIGGNGYFNNAAALRHKMGSGTAWTEPSYWGITDTYGNKNLYFENNTLVNMLEGIDIDSFGRAVLRYNTFINSAVVSHGSDTSGTGGRYFELYNNTFTYDATPTNPTGPYGPAPTNMNGFTSMRGGSAVIWNNTYGDINSGGWWGDKSEVAFLAENVRRGGPYGCWTQGYPFPDQFGWGYTVGGTQAGNTGIYQDPEPVYMWNNTGQGNINNPTVAEYYPNECGDNAPSVTEYIKINRDYYMSEKPGYVPYTYPHPLTTGTVVTPPPPPPQGDTTAPVIGEVSSGTPTETSVTISWTTNEVSTTQVEYGLTASYGSLTNQNNSLVTTHSQAISGLTSGTTYHYRVKSQDATGNLAFGTDRTFTTFSAPIISPTTVTDSIAPKVSITYPANGDTLTRNVAVNITATASDNIAVSKVEFYVSGALRCTDTTAPYTCSWKIPAAKKSYNLQAKVYDTSDNFGVSAVTVTSVK